MVRLVFRPYTQVKRTICTSVSLRASTRVSPGFTLLRHSSPSFGSQQICSYSNLSQVTIGRWCHPVLTRVSHLSKTSLPSLSFRIRVLTTQILAYMLDSLVRVSRRVDENHLVSISNTISDNTTQQIPTVAPRRHFVETERYAAGCMGSKACAGVGFVFPQPTS
jgi:hypothetical protein